MTVMERNDLIGFLLDGHRVLGLGCHEQTPLDPGDHAVPIFRINVYPYRQSCHVCRKTLVDPMTPSWPELFSRSTITRKEDHAP